MIKALKSIFGFAAQFGPVGILICIGAIATVIATITVTLFAMAGDTKQKFINTYEYERPLSLDIVNQNADDYLNENDKSVTDNYLRSVGYAR